LPGWDTFAVIAGGAAAALVGALFVSVSIRIEVISASPEFRNRGAETLCLLMAVVLVAVLLAIPGQRRWELGAELLVLALALALGLSWLDRRASAGPSSQPISRVLDVVSPRTITSALLALAGLLLVAGVDDGAYVVVPPEAHRAPARSTCAFARASASPSKRSSRSAIASTSASSRASAIVRFT
jgi:hypothetical protein